MTIIFKGASVNAKSIMQVMLAGITQGSEIEVCCEGADEQEALDEAVRLIESGLGE